MMILTENLIFSQKNISLSLVFSVLLPLILIKVSEKKILNKVAQNNKEKVMKKVLKKVKKVKNG